MSPKALCFKLQGCWLHSQTPVTYFSKLLGICSFAAYLQLELFSLQTVFHILLFVVFMLMALDIIAFFKSGLFD